MIHDVSKGVGSVGGGGGGSENVNQELKLLSN